MATQHQTLIPSLLASSKFGEAVTELLTASGMQPARMMNKKDYPRSKPLASQSGAPHCLRQAGTVPPDPVTGADIHRFVAFRCENL